jgi:hypothetical protein
VAETLNPNLHPQVAGAVWQRIGETPCARGLEPADRAWIDLFAAVAARDASRMAELGVNALEPLRNTRGPAGEYAFMAAVTGALKQGDTKRARQLLGEGTRSWLRPGQRRSEMGYLFNLANRPAQ